MALKKLLLFPFNGNAIEALDCISGSEYQFLGFIDDSPEKLATKHKYPVFDRSVLNTFSEALVLAVPGSPTSFKNRKDFIDSLQLTEERFATIIHPKAFIGRDVEIGFNSLILAGVVLTSNAKVGNNVCILPNSVVHHDSKIGNYTLIGSNVVVAGGTIVGENCYIGSGSNIINNISIGNGALVGLGSNVIKSVASEYVIVGNPAKPIQK
jgi:UDP-perosamine 4-acetyltransferase